MALKGQPDAVFSAPLSCRYVQIGCYSELRWHVTACRWIARDIFITSQSANSYFNFCTLLAFKKFLTVIIWKSWFPHCSNLSKKLHWYDFQRLVIAVRAWETMLICSRSILPLPIATAHKEGAEVTTFSWQLVLLKKFSCHFFLLKFFSWHLILLNFFSWHFFLLKFFFMALGPAEVFFHGTWSCRS